MKKTSKKRSDTRFEETKRFQEYMPIIRQSLGWTPKDLARESGIKEQVIINLETTPPRTALSNERYIALRSILSKEIEKRPEETKILQTLLLVCVDRYDESSDKERNEIIEKAKIVTPSVVAKETSLEIVNEMWLTIVPFVLGLGIGFVVGTKYNSFGWLDNIGTNTVGKAIINTTKQIK